MTDRIFLQGGAGGLKLWNAATGEIERRFRDPEKLEASMWSGVVSADGKVIAAQSADSNLVLVWNLNGTLRRNVKAPISVPLSLSPDGDLLAANGGNAVKIFDAREVKERADASAQPLHILPLDNTLLGYLNELSWSPDGANLAVSDGGAVKLFDPHSGALRATLYTFRKPLPRDKQNSLAAMPDAWLAVTPDGFYDASPSIDAFIRWRVGNELFPATRFAKLFKQPGKVRQTLRP